MHRHRKNAKRTDSRPFHPDSRHTCPRDRPVRRGHRSRASSASRRGVGRRGVRLLRRELVSIGVHIQKPGVENE
jgi:hypothetical protein